MKFNIGEKVKFKHEEMKEMFPDEYEVTCTTPKSKFCSEYYAVKTTEGKELRAIPKDFLISVK